jgi:hypothetical protein
MDGHPGRVERLLIGLITDLVFDYKAGYRVDKRAFGLGR